MDLGVVYDLVQPIADSFSGLFGDGSHPSLVQLTAGLLNHGFGNWNFPALGIDDGTPYGLLLFHRDDTAIR